MARSNQEWIFLQGKGKYIKTKRPNDWGKWTCMLYPNNESLEKIRELQGQGLKNTLKKDEDGYNATFSRPVEKTFKKSGLERKIGFSPVEVLGPDGKPYDGLIGNGSDITVKLEVYQHNTPGGGKAKAARLSAIRIDNLVPFITDDLDEAQQYQIKGLDEQPTQPLF